MRAWTSVLVLALAIGVPATGTIAAAEDRVIEKAKEALEPLLAEFEAARDAMYERMRGLRETEAYQEAYEKRDFETIRGMQDEISKPFMAEWAETFTKKAKPYQGHEAELIFNAAMLQNQLADEPAQLANRDVRQPAARPARRRAAGR